jgi:hypothetical protein
MSGGVALVERRHGLAEGFVRDDVTGHVDLDVHPGRGQGGLAHRDDLGQDVQPWLLMLEQGELDRRSGD